MSGQASKSRCESPSDGPPTGTAGNQALDVQTPLCRPRIGVVADPADEPGQRRAGDLATRLGLELTSGDDSRFDLLLVLTEDRLELRTPRKGGAGPLFVDFVEGPLGYARRVNRFGLLFQAVGFRTGRPRVLDVTAGLGHDAFRLAYHGCAVTAIERSPVIFELLADGLARAERDPEICRHLAGRLRLIHGDGRDVLRALSPEEAPEVIYLDPMFPPKKKSALAKAEIRTLRALVGDDPDAGELFELAMAVAIRRVIVKRHRLAEPLAPNPTHSHSDKTTRYDVYVPGAHRRVL